ncbi:MAG: NADH-quinone oxidoreductase subunit K [Deltaproteobacteria bacterium]|jgi:NADH:ubiquinone oxidoreductase subunit K|nr:MAG: NADH-quinone oxidoreductase subunit K [Deltaproteobacteria bacterium]
MIEKEIYPLLVLFFMAMAGVLLRRNILTSILCLNVMTISISLMLLFSQKQGVKISGIASPSVLVMYSLFQIIVGVLLAMRFYKEKKTLITDEMKIKVQ